MTDRVYSGSGHQEPQTVARISDRSLHRSPPEQNGYRQSLLGPSTGSLICRVKAGNACNHGEKAEPQSSSSSCCCDSDMLDGVAGFPNMDRWLEVTFGIVPKGPPDDREPEMDILDDNDSAVLKEAAVLTREGQGNNLNHAPNVIGRLSYQWFCMEEKLNVLETCYPRQPDGTFEVPAHLDIIREVNRRWKVLQPHRKQKFVEIATYQYEQEFGPVPTQQKNNSTWE